MAVHCLKSSGGREVEITPIPVSGEEAAYKGDLNRTRYSTRGAGNHLKLAKEKHLWEVETHNQEKEQNGRSVGLAPTQEPIPAILRASSGWLSSAGRTALEVSLESKPSHFTSITTKQHHAMSHFGL